MPEPTARDIYFNALGLDGSEVGAQRCETCQRDSRREKALERAHQLRKFEIENYWKRATYFWAFQLASFALLGLIWEEVANNKLLRDSLLIPAALGSISAFIGYLTAKGSKFWQQNWASHVDGLEEDFEGRLTQVIFYTGKTPYSVSRLNQVFMGQLCLGWLAGFIVIAFEPLEVSLLKFHPWPAITLVLLALVYLWFQVTSLGGFFYHGERAKKIRLYERKIFTNSIDKFIKRLFEPSPEDLNDMTYTQTVGLGNKSGLIMRDSEVRKAQATDFESST